VTPRRARLAAGVGCLVLEGLLVAVAVRVGLRNSVPDWTGLDQAWVAIALAAGTTAVGSGVVLLHRRGGHLGLYAIGTGLLLTAWLACNLSSSAGAIAVAPALGVLFRVLLGALVLSWPIGRLARADRIGLGLYAANLGFASLVFLLASPTVGDDLANPLNVVSLPTLVQVVQQVLVITLVPVWGVVLVVVVFRRSRQLPTRARALARPGMVAALVAGGADVVLFFSDRLLSDVTAAVSVGRWIDVGRFGAVPLILALASRRSPVAGERLRTVDVGATGTADLQLSLVRGLGDPTARLAFRRPDGSWVGPTGAVVTLGGSGRSVTSVEQDEAVVAAIEHDPALDDRPSVVEAALATVALALEHTRLDALALARLRDAQQARLAIVAAEDAARHRLERDLHDGAQQRLVGLALQTRLAMSGSPDANELVALDHGVEEARRDLRAIIDDAVPAIVAERGLASALDMLATMAPTAIRLDVVVSAEVPAPVGATAWYVVSETVANATKHAHAHELVVRVATREGELCVEVADDGRGGAEVSKGGGLAGLRRRVTSLGGTFSVSSPPAGGTVVRVALPFGDPR
jgi:signal transduction histidine kinase